MVFITLDKQTTLKGICIKRPETGKKGIHNI